MSEQIIKPTWRDVVNTAPSGHAKPTPMTPLDDIAQEIMAAITHPHASHDDLIINAAQKVKAGVNTLMGIARTVLIARKAQISQGASV